MERYCCRAHKVPSSEESHNGRWRRKKQGFSIYRSRIHGTRLAGTKFATQIRVDQNVYDSPTHKVDCFKNGIGLELEWNNKTEFYDRDLNNFRLLFELRALNVGVIITRCDELQSIFDSLGRGSSYGPTTTILSKLLRKMEGGSGGGCPVLVFGIRKSLYDENS
jgi:hypothetical protein